MVSCGRPSNINHGRLICSNFTYRSVAMFECSLGFDLVGQATITCTANRSWSSLPPVCMARHCPTPNNTNQHRSSSTNHTVSSTTTFQCDTGYESNNSLSVYCHYNQSWSSVFPTCTPVKCPKPVQNPNVLLAIPTPAEFNGEQLNASCATGYTVKSGNATRHCLASGKWSGSDVVCQRVTCPSLVSPANGLLNSTQGFTYEATVYFDCNTGYFLSGSQRRNLTCTSSAVWSGDMPSCKSKPVCTLLSSSL